jgi:uncharacterized protein
MRIKTMTTPPLNDDDIERLQELLQAVPEPLEPLDATALDGFLCGVLLQPKAVPAEAWLRFISDVDGRPAPDNAALHELHALAQRRHSELNLAIHRREWFDPWIYPAEDDDSGDGEGAGNPSESVLPWVAGFAAAMDNFPELMAIDHPELIEPLALLYLHFAPEDLEDADALQAVIDTIEPPDNLAEAVQDIVRALMLIADISRPRPAPPKPARSAKPGRGRPAQRGRR